MERDHTSVVATRVDVLLSERPAEVADRPRHLITIKLPGYVKMNVILNFLAYALTSYQESFWCGLLALILNK
jgi:hypothetical protein